MENQENKENELEIQPIKELILAPTQNLEAAIQHAEKYLAFQDKIRKLAVNLTNAGDWVNEDGRPYLQWTGASKIARAFGVSYENPHFEKEIEKDEHGEYINYYCSATIQWNGQSMPEIGSASTRDAFFGIRSEYKNGRKEKVYLPLSEIDITDIKKKALTNFLNRGIKSLLGLSYSWEEIEQITNNKINRQNVQQVHREKGKYGGQTDSPETSKMRESIKKMVLEMASASEWGEKQKAWLEAITTFRAENGDVVKGKCFVAELSEKQVKLIYEKTMKLYESWSKKIEDAFAKATGVK